MAATAKAARSAASARNPANRSTPDRRSFALTGPSKALDHRQYAARRDLADIAVAGRWFAPHYAIAESRSCRFEGADILSAPSDKGARISQLLPGEHFAVLEQSGDWAWGYSEHDCYVGYVRAAALGKARTATHAVTARNAVVFGEPTSRAAALHLLPMGSRLSGALEGKFIRVAEGYVAVQQVEPLDEIAGDPVSVAERLIGVPYVWGGRGLGGVDCSGLVQIAFGLAGVALPRDSDQQMTAGNEVKEPLRRGDLLFYDDHVILLTAPDHAIHASGHWMSTVVEPLANILARMGEPVARRRMRS